ncbi:MAG: iron-sulfur cluster assembly accessory protein [Spirochaetota bacterium]
MLGISDSAVKQFKQILEDSNASKSGIRIFMSGQSCCGVSYGMGITENGDKNDQLLEKDGLKIFIDSVISEGLSEATIDFNQQGFVIQGNPSSGCSSGCSSGGCCS